MKMFCLSLHPEHLNNLKKINYIPVGLGEKVFSNEWLRDNIGENISFKNKHYGEYTFHYWLWKNMLKKMNDDEWIGFCAYRHYWADSNKYHSDEINKIINNENFIDFVLKNKKNEWNDYNVILGEKMKVDKLKFMKVFKNGGIKSIVQNFKPIIKRKCNIRLQFDIFHGNNILDRAIAVLDTKDRTDFKNFVENESSFNRENMFICKSKSIINSYYESIFEWLKNCEKIFGFNLHKWNEIRLYAFLAERYLPYWFNKYSKPLVWPIFFFDTYKNKLQLK
jgi:hypothetical protein